MLRRLINLTPKEQINDKEFQQHVEESKTVKEVWRRHYNIPLSDPRWKEATELDILEDVARIIANNFDEEYNNSSDPKFAEFKKKVVVNPEYAQEWKQQAEDALNKQSLFLLKDYGRK